MSERLVLRDVPASLWTDFHSGRAVPLESDLVSCWSRARMLGAPADGLPPEERLIRGDALREHTGPLELIQALGESVLERATAEVSERDFLLLLADAEGVVVRSSGGGGFRGTAQQVRLIEGANWSEAARGTNAIGTALATRRPTEVHGSAHFGRSYHDLVCYAAPVRGLDGTPVAVLDATSRVVSADPAVAHSVIQAAQALEDLIRLQAYASAGLSVTRVLGHTLDRISDPALLIESPGTIVRANGAARALLGPSIAGCDPFAALGVAWPALVREAVGGAGGRPVELGAGAARRRWRLQADPIAAPSGVIVVVLVTLEPLRALAPVQSRRLASDPFGPIFAEDQAVLSAIDWSRQLAKSELPVMLLAETGAGKELFAQAIHAASPRASGPWHAINCGALTPSLLESELFGYAPGAFTGAERSGRTGLFHAAQGGTLFLDEVAEMSPAMQASLLRVLETNTYRRVGDVRLERTDVRIICATCRDLPALVASGAFRQDLYYRLKGATVRIPPLRERSDVVALAEELLGEGARLTPAAREAILQHRWPGNVRELKSVLAVAQVTAGAGQPIDRPHLSLDLAPPSASSPLEDGERTLLLRVLAETQGNVSRAAERLGVARTTLRRMKRRHGVE